MKPSIRIVAVDTYLPTRVRANNEWPASVVNDWRARLANVLPRSTAAVDKVTDGVRASLEAITALSDDPFQGLESVRVIADEDVSSDLETRAARQALALAGLTANDVDLMLSHTMVPDYMCVNQASIVHEKLGLPRTSPAFSVDSVCTSFVVQLDCARKAILAGDAKRVLVTQSTACSRIMPEAEPFSPWFGDGASAAVLAEAEPGYGMLSMSFRTWGHMAKAFCATVPGGRWYDGGKVVACNEDRVAARRMQLEAMDIARDVIHETLEKADVKPGDVKLLATHQPAVWFPEVCRKHAGLNAATVMPTFKWTGNVSSVNIPIQLSIATRERVLHKGDIVVLFALGAGMSAACTVMRWS